MYSLETITSEQGHAMLPELIALLHDAVASGASVGFLPPLSEEEAREYWTSVLEDITQKKRVLLIARHATQVVGAVQLELATKANARHRAEVQKLFVWQHARRRGIGRLLMEAIEPIAREYGRSLVVLDTRSGDDAERLPPEAAEFWYITYHTLFWLDLNLTGSLKGFAPPRPLPWTSLTRQASFPRGLIPGMSYTPIS